MVEKNANKIKQILGSQSTFKNMRGKTKNKRRAKDKHQKQQKS